MACKVLSDGMRVQRDSRIAERAGGAGGAAVAALRRLPGEGGRAFSLRINSAVRALSHPHDQDYPVSDALPPPTAHARGALSLTSVTLKN